MVLPSGSANMAKEPIAPISIGRRTVLPLELLGASELLVQVADAHVEGHVRRHLGRCLDDAACDPDFGPVSTTL